MLVSKQASAPSRRTVVLRSAGFVVAAALGVVGVWLVVTGSDSKGVRVGAICAFWGLLIGTYSVFGSRVPAHSAEPVAVAPAPPPPPSRELDIRQITEIERSAVAEARREFQQELQLMLRRELHGGFSQELASLRHEVDALRNEIVEKVGGQLRLERIETTRLIGSDLEAVQSELRKLRLFTAEPDGTPAPLAPPAVADPLPAQLRVTPGDAVAVDVHDAEIVDEPADEPVREPAVEPAREPVIDVAPEPTGDPFASMPRLTPFTEFGLDPAAAAEQPPTADDDDGARGRRHRADDDENDVLARILAREQH